MPSTTDHLTGLPNRRALVWAVEHRLAAGEAFALLRATARDPEGLRRTLGATAGAAWLRQVGHRLAGAAGYETLARLEGAELALLAPARTPAEATAVASRLAYDLEWPVPAHGMHLRVKARIGMALAPANGGDAATLLRRARAARRRAEALDLTWSECE